METTGGMIESKTSVRLRPELTEARKGLLERRLKGALKAPSLSAAIPRRAPAASAPLSFSQNRLWFIDQLEPGSPAYHVATTLKLTGPLDVSALEQGLQMIVDRHEALRTRFPAVDGNPIQVIDPALKIELRMVDLSQLLQSDRESRCSQHLKEAAQEPFNLATGPLIRTLLVRINDQEHSLLAVMHHIISDGWSLGVLFHELELAYQSITGTAPVTMPDLRIQYADYAQWQQQTVVGENLDANLNWWKTKLEHAPASLQLPVDETRQDIPSILRGATRAVTLPAELTAQMQALSRTHAATPFMTLLSGILILLHRWTRQTDLVIGTVVAGRTARETENLIGCFMNFVPIRTRLTGPAESGLELLEQVKTNVLESYAHQDCPFDKIVEAINPDRRLNQNPLYNVGLLLQNYPRNVFKAGPLTGAMQTIRTDTALLDLRFIAEETGNELAVYCEYDTGLFHADTIDALLESLVSVLQSFVANPSKGLRNFSLSDRLQRQYDAVQARRQTQTITIAGTFTCEPIADSLQFWMEKLELPVVTRFAAYNQVFQELLDPSGSFATNTSGLNAILLRLQDWLRNLPDTASSPDLVKVHLQQTSNELVAGLKRAAAQSGTPFLVCFCPSALRENAAPWRQLLAETETELASLLKGLTGVHVIESDETLRLYPVKEVDDPGGDELGHIPYSTEFYAALGTMIARRFHALKRPPRKVIALDCDNTLWSGICGEDGPGGIRIDEPRKVLQEFMREQLDAGMLLCLCSKNNPEDVEEVFRRHRMPLRRDQFAACRLNWEPKSRNLRALAQELNLGLDSFIFIDDNPIECAEVEANSPGVLVVQLPEDLNSFSRFLSHLWILDHPKVTEEDRKRTELYLQNRQREQFQAEAVTFADFLGALNLQINIEPARPEQLSRVAQLTERTNQFNFTTRRRNESEIAKLRKDPSFELLAISVTDRFGDYGLVGVVIYQLTRHAIDIDTFLLSCRVLGKGVEHRILSHLGEVARAQGRPWVDVHFAHSPKNKPAFDFLERVGASFRHGSNGSTLFRFPAEFAQEIVFMPESSPPIPAATAPREGGPTAPEPANSFAARFTACRSIAMDSGSAGGILQQIESRKVNPAHKQQPYIPPRTELERQLCDLWQRLLRVERVGVHDDFFALGGTSLLAVRLFAEFEKLSGKKLPLVTLFRSPTVEQLAKVAAPKASADVDSALVAIQPHGDKPPLILIHGAGGGILWGYANLAAALPPDQPVYAIDPRWTAGRTDTNVEEMAQRYIVELRSLQSRGPYRLGGYCFGGYVAYEMARQLQLAGEETALLLLIDSAAPNGPYDRLEWWRPAFLPRFLRNTAYWIQDFLRLEPAERSELIKRKMGVLKRSFAQRVSPSGRSVIDVEEFIDTSQFPDDELKLWQIHLRAGGDYKPKSYAGRVTLLRTRRQPFLCSFDPFYGWGDLAEGGVEIHLIPGSHEAIFVEPDVVALAAQVNARLETVQNIQPKSQPVTEKC